MGVYLVQQKAYGPTPLCLATTKALEDVRAVVTAEQLREWSAQVRPELEGIDRRFCFNVDEISDQPRSEAKPKTVVSATNVPTIYEMARPGLVPLTHKWSRHILARYRPDWFEPKDNDNSSD